MTLVFACPAHIRHSCIDAGCFLEAAKDKPFVLSVAQRNSVYRAADFQYSDGVGRRSLRSCGNAMTLPISIRRQLHAEALRAAQQLAGQRELGQTASLVVADQAEYGLAAP